MEHENLTVEDIERKQKLLNLLFKLFVAIMILIGCIFVGWLISFIGYADSISAVEPDSRILFVSTVQYFC